MRRIKKREKRQNEALAIDTERQTDRHKLIQTDRNRYRYQTYAYRQTNRKSSTDINDQN